MGKNTKGKIREIAFSLFAANGYDATTMDQIAAGVGIKKPTLYAYITSKEDLFLSIYEELQKDYCSYMEEQFDATEGMPISERLYNLFKQYIRYFTQNMERAALWNRILFFPPLSLKNIIIDKVHSSEMMLGEKLKDIMKEGMSQGILRKATPEDMLLAYYSFRGGLLALALVFPPKEKQDPSKLDNVWQNFWLGIKERQE